MSDKTIGHDDVDATVISRVTTLKRERRFQDALHAINAAEQTAPGDETAKYLEHLKAEVLQDEGRYSEAVGVYDRIISNGPDAVAYANRGMAYLSLGNLQRALADYLIAVSLDPKDSVGLLHLGEILIKMERYVEATSYLHRAHEINPQSVEIITSLGIAFYNTDDWSEAYRFLKLALELDPENRIATLGIKKMDEHLELND